MAKQIANRQNSTGPTIRPLDVLGRLSTSLGRRDEVPNQVLAAEIAAAGDRNAVQLLVDTLSSPSPKLHSDCIKVLYEVAERAPELVADHCDALAGLLQSRKNRLVWGAMIALDAIALSQPAAVARLLPTIIATADRGSVITRDHAVGILVKLAEIKAYRGQCIPMLLRQLANCPDNQLPMYAEAAAPVFKSTQSGQFTRLLTRRKSTLPKASQQKRIARVLRQLEK